MHKPEQNSDSAEVRNLKQDAERRIHSGESAKSALQHEATALRHHETQNGHFSKDHYQHELKLLKTALKHDDHIDLSSHADSRGHLSVKAKKLLDNHYSKIDKSFAATDLRASEDAAGKRKDATSLVLDNPFIDKTTGKFPNIREIAKLPDASVRMPGEHQLSFSPGVAGNLEVFDEHRKPVDIWPRSHNALVDKAHSVAPDTALFGDSITDGMSLNNDLFNLHGKTANFGIHGDTPQNLRYRLEHGELDFKDGKAPKNFVVLIGTNDLGKGKSNEQIARDAVGDAELIAKKFPQSKVLVLGLLPRGGYRDDVSDVNKYINQDVSDLHNSKIHFSDIGPTMLERDGSMSSELWQGDFTHPTYQKGNSRMLGAIKKILDANE